MSSLSEVSRPRRLRNEVAPSETMVENIESLFHTSDIDLRFD